MYSGTTLKPMRKFDAWFGAHQKIDRVARVHLGRLIAGQGNFPTRKQIIGFEGYDGPDGIKRKTPAQGEPWHYYNPEDASDVQILEVLEKNYQELVAALKKGNMTRAGFEAAWLAHGIVDGLTPAHHYPYEKELMRLRGSGLETRTSAKDKVIIPGENIPDRVSKNWQMWGDKGLLATHMAFEWGVAVMIVPLRLTHAMPSDDEIRWVLKNGISELFKERAGQIADLHMYDTFYKSGWNARLAKQVRKQLVPSIINTVTLAWYAAFHEAELSKT